MDFAGVDSVWEQEKLEARKMFENAAESHKSTALFVSRRFDYGLILSQLHQFEFDLDTN